MICNERQLYGKVEQTVHYDIAASTRSPLGIGNGLYWVLDIVFWEDYHHLCKDYAPETFAAALLQSTYLNRKRRV